MKIRISALLLGCWLMSGAAATAAPVTYDCDTVSGSFSVIEQVQAGPAYHLRGTISPRQWRSDRRWAPSARLSLTNADGSRAIAVTVVRQPDRQRADVSVETREGGQPNTTNIGSVGLNETAAVDLSIPATGDAVATVGAERRAVHIDLGTNAKMSVTCSTGEFLFGDLDWGG